MTNDITLKCKQCGKNFCVQKKQITQVEQAPNKKRTLCFCSRKCARASTKTSISVNCFQCGKCFSKLPSQINKSPNHFCSRSCAAIYNNTHKTKGNRRSKLEIWLEQQLTIRYPNLEFHFNKKEAINSELDIYIPSLNLAFELNGIFHYEPIYGSDKLASIKNNDGRKFQACLETNIELVIIDTSSLNYFKETSALKYLHIIVDLISIKQ